MPTASEPKDNAGIRQNKYLKYITPQEANQILRSLKKPQILVTRKQAFTTSFKTFKESFARHCTLLSCVLEVNREEVTLTTLTVVLEKIDIYHKDVIMGGKDFDCGDNPCVGQHEYENYVASLKVICENVQVGDDALLSVVGSCNFSYKPKQFIVSTRNKYKCGVWVSGDDYDSNKLYCGFKDICQHVLNIIH